MNGPDQFSHLREEVLVIGEMSLLIFLSYSLE